MTLGELLSVLRAASNDPNFTRLTVIIEQWKSEPAFVEDLRDSVERYIGNSWIASDKEHEQIYRLWSMFRDDNIRSRLAMIMNERLFAFDLFEQYETSRTQEGKAVALRKVDHANGLKS